MLYKYIFHLANGEERYLVTEMNYKEIKYYIKAYDWIELHHYGRIYEGNAIRFTPEKLDVQTCNIVAIEERKDYYKNKLEQQEEDVRKMKIINEIELYKLNWLNQKRFELKTVTYNDEDYEHRLLTFTEEYLNELLKWVKEKGKLI